MVDPTLMVSLFLLYAMFLCINKHVKSSDSDAMDVSFITRISPHLRRFADVLPVHRKSGTRLQLTQVEVSHVGIESAGLRLKME